MKILCYLNNVAKGGAERVLTTLATEFAKKGHCVKFITSYDADDEYYMPKIVNRNTLMKQKNKSFFIRNVLLFFGLRKEIKSFKPDACIAFLPEPSIRLLLASIGVNTRVVVSVRGNPLKEEYKSPFFKVLINIIYRKASHVIFQTKQQQDYFPYSIIKKSRIIPNPVANVFFDTEWKEEKSNNIIACGRLTSAKNYDLLIDAFHSISDTIPHNLVIYGEGELREKLETKIKNLGMEKRIILYGLTDNINQVLSEARAYVLSSSYEGMPNALMEAMAVGVPSIATDCPVGGPRSLIEEHDAGILVEENNREMLASAIKRVVDDYDYSKILSKREKSVMISYRVDEVTKSWEEVLSL